MRDPKNLKQQIRQRSPLTEATLKVAHVRIHDEDPDPFVLGLKLWCEEAVISRVQFRSLRDILRMLEPHPIISKLPDSYQSLRGRVADWLPHLSLRQTILDLNSQQLAWYLRELRVY